MGEVIYSTQRTGFEPGRQYRNPRFYQSPMAAKEVERVIVVGDFPHIARDYERLGIKVLAVATPADLPGVMGSAPVPAAGPLTPTTPSSRTAEPRAEQLAVALPENFRELPWTKPSKDGGLTLRGLAAKVTDTPVVNRDDAIAAIEAEMERRKAKGLDPLLGTSVPAQ